MSTPPIDVLVLDAAPLLSLAPLRGIAKTYVTTPQVLAELRDPRAREHFRKLGAEGVEVFVKSPDVVSYSKVTAAAKKSGDFSVLSQTDMMLLALTLSLHNEYQTSKPSSSSAEVHTDHSMTPSVNENQSEKGNQSNENGSNSSSSSDSEPDSPSDEEDDVLQKREPLDQDVAPSAIPDISKLKIESVASPSSSNMSPPSPADAAPVSEPVFNDPPSDEDDDGEGEWITPDNVAQHKSKEIFSMDSGKAAPTKHIGVGCMTADYAMQNVLLHMGLNLVSPDGKRITLVKTWVLRCHACYKLCKDQTKKFCPSCGNPTLLRASVSTKTAPPGSSEAATVQVHLKSNFQYRNRGSIYSIPAPKAGNAKGTNKNIILREDQLEFQRGLKSESVRARKEEKRINSALASSGGSGENGSKSWLDPDWMPDMMLGQSSRRGSALPDVGYGRRNPNEVRKKKK